MLLSTCKKTLVGANTCIEDLSLLLLSLRIDDLLLNLKLLRADKCMHHKIGWAHIWKERIYLRALQTAFGVLGLSRCHSWHFFPQRLTCIEDTYDCMDEDVQMCLSDQYLVPLDDSAEFKVRQQLDACEVIVTPIETRRIYAHPQKGYIDNAAKLERNLRYCTENE